MLAARCRPMTTGPPGTAEPHPWPDKAKVLAAQLIPPLAAFLVVRAFLWGVAVAGGFDYFDANLWSKSDSAHYLSVAERGYELFDCARIRFHTPGWCGNAGWLPGYPWLIAGLGMLGIPGPLAGVLLSALFNLATLYVSWIGFLGGRRSGRSVLPLILVAFFPGQIYHHAIFPVSMFTFFALLCMLCLARERWVAAGLAGSAAAFSYSTGFLLSPVVGLWVLLAHPGIPWRQRLYRATATAGLVVLGFAAVLLVHHVAVGAWDAFFKVQAKYGHGIHDPLDTFLRALRPLLQGPGGFPAFQTLLVAVTMVGLIVAGAGRRSQLDLLIFLFALTFWLFPLVMGSAVSLYRSEALLMPTALLLRHLPLRAQVVLASTFLLVAYPMAMLFYRALLV